MKQSILSIILLAIFTVVANATQFVQLPIEKQIDEADFAVEATLRSSKVYKNLSGAITTDFFFVVNESFGFPDGELHLEIPIGTFEGVTTMIEGAPSFLENEKVFLLLKKVEGKIYLSNFTMGEYRIVNIYGQAFYRSEVFSLDPRIGMISKDKMKMLMQEKWHYTSNAPVDFKKIVIQKAPLHSPKLPPQIKRLPAQEAKQEDNIFYISLIGGLILSVFLIIGFLLRKNKR